MNKYLSFGFGLLWSAISAFAVQDLAGAAHGTVKRIEADTKTIIIRTADGIEESFRFTGRTAVHGAEMAAHKTGEALHGLKEGSEVAVHYSTKGAEKTANEIDDIGEHGLKTTEGTVKSFDRGAKTVTLKTADGAEETYRLADRAARDTGKEISEGAETSGKVTVYYSEETGHKVAHFFKRVL
jgi:Cu/Ag efflux protein CusF